MRYLMRKRLKNPAPLEITERRQVGDAEAMMNPGPSSDAVRDEQNKRPHYPARGEDSEL
jgi:hypothetical protein